MSTKAPTKPTGRRYKSVQQLREDREGQWTDKKCPECGAKLLRNNLEDEWCSALDCDYGIPKL